MESNTGMDSMNGFNGWNPLNQSLWEVSGKSLGGLLGGLWEVSGMSLGRSFWRSLGGLLGGLKIQKQSLWEVSWKVFKRIAFGFLLKGF